VFVEHCVRVKGEAQYGCELGLSLRRRRKA